MKYFSAFSGIGGFDEGIRRVLPNAECIGYSEINEFAIKIYEKHFPNRTNYGNIRRINPTTIPNFDIFFGGFPCQNLSLAGKREGLCGAKSVLFFEIIRIIREKQPCIVFLENVEGLLSSNGGWDFAKVLVELDECGYDVEWQCLNSKNFGVFQSRKRIYIIGHLRGITWKPIFPIRENSISNNELCQQYTNTITARYYGSQATGSYIIEGELNAQGKSNMRRLTLLEVERLQSYPDGWTEGVSDSKRYECLGNSVTVNVIEAIMKKIVGNIPRSEYI